MELQLADTNAHTLALYLYGIGDDIGYLPAENSLLLASQLIWLLYHQMVKYSFIVKVLLEW